MFRPWGKGATIGKFYRLTKSEDLNRVGSCWMKGRLNINDLILCIKHTGDCFYDYILIKEFGNGLQGLPESEFGAYTCGEPININLNDKEFHLLCAGEFITNSIKQKYKY